MHKKLAFVLLALLTVPLIFLPMNIAKAPISPMWASYVKDYDQGLRKDGTPVLPERSNPNNALGPPDSSGTTVKFFSLGFGGSIILGFPCLIGTGPGADALVIEITWGAYPLEQAKVYGSQDGIAYYFAGTVNNAGLKTVELPAGLLWVRYVKIVDATDESIHGPDADGFDLDAVGAYYQICGTIDKSVSPDAGYLGDVLTVTLNVEVSQTSAMTVEDALPSFLEYVLGTFSVDGVPVVPAVVDGVISTTVQGALAYEITFDVIIDSVEATIQTGENWAYLYYDAVLLDDDCALVTTYPYCGFHKVAMLESTGDGDGMIEVGEEVVWEFRIWVTNLFSWTMEDVVVTDRLGAELEIDDVVSYDGEDFDHYRQGNEKLIWTIGDLEPGETATLILHVSTRVYKGKQAYTSANRYEFNSGATLKFLNLDGIQLSAHTGQMVFDVPGEWPHFQPYCVRYPETGNVYIGYEDWPNGDFDYNDFGMTFSFEEIYDANWNLFRVTMTFTAIIYDSGMEHLIHIKRPINGPSVVTVARPNPRPSAGPILGKDETPAGTYPFTGDVDVILFNTNKYTWPEKQMDEVVTVEITVVDPTLNPKDHALVPPRTFTNEAPGPFDDMDAVMANYDPWEEGTLYGSLYHIHSIQSTLKFGSPAIDVPYILVVPFSDWIPPYESTMITGPYGHFDDFYRFGTPDNWYDPSMVTHNWVGSGGLSWGPYPP